MGLQDDTELDALAAQVRAFPPMSAQETGWLLTATRDGSDSARERLVDQQLRFALDEAITRGNRGLEVVDLYQEGALAAIVAVTEYASRGGGPAGLGAYVSRVIGAHLEDVLEENARAKEAENDLVRDVELYETAEVALRQEFGRSATVVELASVLEWPEDRVILVGEMLTSAREMYDADIVQYLDDESDAQN
jgi:DNA-directed RNA polymerase sigma subunit (sigma70/sigma32)